MKLEDIEKLCAESIISSSDGLFHGKSLRDARVNAQLRRLLPKFYRIAKAAKALDLRHLPCDERLEQGWNTVHVLEHYSTCRKCAFTRALEELEKE